MGGWRETERAEGEINGQRGREGEREERKRAKVGEERKEST